jgi:hypothetical protein
VGRWQDKQALGPAPQVSDYKEDDRAAPPAGLIVEKAREETLIRGRHTDAWGFLKGLEEADHEERFLR